MKTILIILGVLCIQFVELPNTSAQSTPQTSRQIKRIQNIGPAIQKTTQVPIDSTGIRTFSPEYFNFYLIKYYKESDNTYLDSLTEIKIVTKPNIKVIDHPIELHPGPGRKSRWKLNLSIRNVEVTKNIKLMGVDFTSLKFDSVKLNDFYMVNCGIEDFQFINNTSNGIYRFHKNTVGMFHIHKSTFNKGLSLVGNSNNKPSNFRISNSTINGGTTQLIMGKDSPSPMKVREVDFFCDRTQFKGNQYHYYPFGSNLYKCNFKGNTVIETINSSIFISDKDTFYLNVKYNLVKLEDLNIDGRMDFKGYLPNKMILKNISINGKLDFSNIDFDERCRADFVTADIENIKINPRNFRFSRMDVRSEKQFTKLKNFPRYKTRELNNLESVYKRFLWKAEKEGLSEDYELLDLNYKRYKYGTMGRSNFFEGTYYFTAKYWWNFGYDKYRVLIWTCVFILFFWLINYVLFDRLIDKVYTIKNIKSKYNLLDKTSLSTLNFGLKKMELSFYYTMIIFFGIKLDNENFHYDKFRLTIYVYFMYTLGLICIAFIFNYIFSI